jgi:predicted glycoside hydrolase/deacetylase ChbG (UPF0249 family)
VSALMTFKNPGDKLIKLAEEARNRNLDVHFGVHLSFTAGSPVLGDAVPSLTESNGKFYPVDAYDYDRTDPYEVHEEARAQIKLFTQTGLKLDHLSCHHGIMQLFPEYFKIYLLLAAEFNVPVRNPVLISKEKIKGYKLSAMKREGLFRGIECIINEGFDQVLINTGTLSREGIKRKMKVFKGGRVKCPDHFVDSFYKNGNKKQLEKILRYLPKGEKSELVVHLGDGHYTDSTEEQRKYNGINIGYFDGRKEEFRTITHDLNTGDRIANDNGLDWGSYRD